MKISKLKFFRLQEGLSQQEAADHIGISRGYLSQLENNQAALSGEIMLKMSKVYNVRPKDLI